MSVYKDFLPQALTKPSMFHNRGVAEYEHFDAAAEAAVAWVKENDVKVLSIETVVLPNLPDMGDNQEGVMFNEMSSLGFHYQFVRVWYLQS